MGTLDGYELLVRALVLTLVGVGAMNSPRYAPAGLLVSWHGRRVMLDGGGAATPRARVDAWLVTDASAELMPDIRRRCGALGLRPSVAVWQADGLTIRPRSVEHTSHPTVGYLIAVADRRVVWAPEFRRFPTWAAGADLMFADAAGWRHPIRFAGGVGGHAAVVDTAEHARRLGVVRLVFAHIGRPSIRAIDAGENPPYGEWAVQGRQYRIAFPTVGGPHDRGGPHDSRQKSASTAEGVIVGRTDAGTWTTASLDLGRTAR